MPPTPYDAAWAPRHAEWKRSNRRFNIMMGSICGGVVLLLVAFVWVLVATEPQRRAAYMADCQQKGFTADQCRFLYAERARQDSNDAVALSLSAAALGLAASRR
jgi:hypothetical protein